MESDFVNKIMRTLNIYSFIVELFINLEKESVQNIHKMYHKIIKNNASYDLYVIDDLIDELNMITPTEFKEWIKIWIEEYNKTKLDKIVFCYMFLLKIDNKINNFITISNPLVKFLVNKGPLDCDEPYMFFYKMPNSFFQEKLNNGKIRLGRQTVEYDVNSLNMDFMNFEIIKSSQLLEYKPVVMQYNHKYTFSDELKIAFSPLSIEKWFNVNTNSESKEFEVNYISSEEQNKKIKEILMECDNLNADVVIFPELAISLETKAEIEKFIINSTFKSLKLFFLGSIWHNNINEALLINNQGSILLREQKTIPYKFYDKTEGCYYTEAIHKNKIINFLDIEGIGRIAYLICADYNDDNLNAICSKMHTNFIFVSAFTDSTDLMLKTAKSHAERKAISTLLCNSCAALDYENNRNYTCFATTPKVDNKKLTTSFWGNNFSCEKIQNCGLCLKLLTLKRI